MPSPTARPTPATRRGLRPALPARAAALVAIALAVGPTLPAHAATPSPGTTTAGTGPASSDTTMTVTARPSAAAQRQLAVVKATSSTTRAGRRIAGLDPLLRPFTWTRPVAGTHQTSGFGTRWGRLHAGADFAGPIGLPIRSVCGGTVAFAGPQGAFGNKVEVKCWDGSSTIYGHMNAVAATVGQRVEPGTRIGFLGNTGRSTGPHLHFEVRPDGVTPIDPIPWMNARGIRPLDTPAPGARPAAAAPSDAPAIRAGSKAAARPGR